MLLKALLLRSFFFQVEIPKFRLEKEYELNNVLTKMGMVEAFSSNANFSKMTTEGIFISKMIHKTFIQVILYFCNLIFWLLLILILLIAFLFVSKLFPN